MKVEIEKEELEVLKSKAAEFDFIQNGIAEFYDEESKHYQNGNEPDLIQIGEWIASYCGWL